MTLVICIMLMQSLKCENNMAIRIPVFSKVTFNSRKETYRAHSENVDKPMWLRKDSLTGKPGMKAKEEPSFAGANVGLSTVASFLTSNSDPYFHMLAALNKRTQKDIISSLGTRINGKNHETIL